MNALKSNSLIRRLLTNSFHDECISSLRKTSGCKAFTKSIHLVSTLQNMDPEQNIVWFDGEMTGLDPNKYTLIEAAIIVTDKDLRILAESPNVIIHQSDEILENMEAWPLKNHRLSGLTEQVRKSNISIEQADQMFYDFIMPFTTKGACPMAGNSIYMDRMFVRKYLPKLESHLHYRLIDVSTLKELYKRWEPEIVNNMPKKEFKHRALDDIRESIQELHYYKNILMLRNN